VWDRVEAAAASHPMNRPSTNASGRHVPGAGPAPSTSSFPTLGSSSTGPARNAAPHSTPWASGGAGSTSRAPTALAGPVIRSVNYPVATLKKAKPLSNNAFPSLMPSNPNRVTQEDKKGLFSKPVARDVAAGGPAGPEGGRESGGAEVEGMEGMSLENGSGGQGAKKKGKGKQLLFTVGART
jgi:hypothetical protein